MVPKPLYEILPLLYGVLGIIGLMIGHNGSNTFASICGGILLCSAVWITWARHSYRLVAPAKVKAAGKPSRRCSYR